MAAQSPEAVEAYLARAARKETFLLYTFGAMLLCLLLIIVILIGPAL
jgi:t-SNARE complex subunit (syntaxin)